MENSINLLHELAIKIHVFYIFLDLFFFLYYRARLPAESLRSDPNTDAIVEQLKEQNAQLTQQMETMEKKMNSLLTLVNNINQNLSQ